MKKARNLAFTAMFIVNVGLTLALLYLFIGRGYFVVAGFTSAEVVTIVLAAVSIILTALGIFIAIMAIWGYQSLHNIAKEHAEKIAGEKAETVAARVAADYGDRMMQAATTPDYGRAAGEEDDAKQ